MPAPLHISRFRLTLDDLRRRVGSLPVGVEVGLVVLIFAGWFVSLTVAAWGLDGDAAGTLTDADMATLIGHEVALGAAAGLVLWLRGWTLARFSQPLAPNATLGVALALALCAQGLHLGNWLLLGPSPGADPVPTPDAGAVAVSVAMVLLFSVVNGLYEEFFLCGYLLAALRERGPVVALGVSAAVRVSYHLYQDLPGVASVLTTGLVFSLYHWHRRRLGPVVVAHAALDAWALWP
jgi:membrane protease YdiL (CAAX protease family)